MSVSFLTTPVSVGPKSHSYAARVRSGHLDAPPVWVALVDEDRVVAGASSVSRSGPRGDTSPCSSAIELLGKALGHDPRPDPPRQGHTLAETLAALERVAGRSVTARIRWEPDPLIQKIVAGWPQRFSTPRAERLGFAADASLDEIVQQHIDDELGGRFAR